MSQQRYGKLRVLGIAGSLRDASFNRRLIEAARELAPEGMEIEPHPLDSIPLYNADLDTDERRPAGVERLRRSIERADALLISTPEYNHGVPGVLKNAIDWASRPGMRSPLRDTPVGIMSAATGALGGARAQQELGTVLAATLALVMPHPGVVVGKAREKFDGDRLADERTREFLAGFLDDLATWTRRVAPREERQRSAA